MEMIDIKEYDTAHVVLSKIQDVMKRENPDRCTRLERMLGGRYETVSFTGGASKSQRRDEIFEALQSELTVMCSNRLLTLLQRSMKWELLRGR